MSHSHKTKQHLLRSESGEAILILVLMAAVFAALLGTGACLYISGFEKRHAQEKTNRIVDSAAHSAMEITNALITGHVLIKDSTRDEWTFDTKTLPSRSDSLVFQPPGTPWSGQEARWVVNALTAKQAAHASLLRNNPLRLDAGFYEDEQLDDLVVNSVLSAPLFPTLVINTDGAPSLVELKKKPNTLDDEIAIFVAAAPYSKSVRARVGGLCQDYDTEPLAMFYRNFQGREPTWQEAASFYNGLNYPFSSADLLAVKAGLGGSSSAAQARIPASSKEIVVELYKMYLARVPTDEESIYLVNLLDTGGMTFAQAEAAMKTSPVYWFSNPANSSHYYTTDKAAGFAKGFEYGGVEFYVYGDATVKPFAPLTTRMTELFSCHNTTSDVYFLSVRSDCQNAALTSSTLEVKLGHLYSYAELSSIPLFEYYRTAGTPDVLTTISSTIPTGYLLSPGQSALVKLAYASQNDNRLASAIALYRTFFAQQLSNTEAFSYNAIFARASHLDPDFAAKDHLAWLRQTFASYKIFHDIEGCGAGLPPPPQCYLTGPSQVAPGTTAKLELHAYGEFTSVMWDGVEYSEPDDRSTIGTHGFIEEPKEEELIKPRTIDTTTSFTSGIIGGASGTSATVSIVAGGVTLSSTCRLPGKSVDFTVTPSYPQLSSVFVTKKSTASLGYNQAFNFHYRTHGFASPRCQVVGLVDSCSPTPFTSAWYTETERDVPMSVGINETTQFKITCWDSDQSFATNQATAEVFPEPTCVMSGCAVVTTGYAGANPFTLAPLSYPDKATWDAELIDSQKGIATVFPAVRNKSTGVTQATVNSPGGTSICGTAVVEIPPPPPICPGPICTSVADATDPTRTTQVCTQQPCYPAPIPAPTGCSTWQGTPSPAVACITPPLPTCLTDPSLCPPKSCKIKILSNAQYNCVRDHALTTFKVFIPADSTTPVIDLYYGKKTSTNYPCAKVQPAPPPDSYLNPADGLVYVLNDGKRWGGWGSIDCKVQRKNESPLMIDLNDEGIQLTSVEAGAKFDLTGDGYASLCAWPRNPKNSTFLAYDLNGDGVINNIHELFGNKTKGPDSKKARNGFLALRKYDDNRDGIIDIRDAIFTRLRVWFPYTKGGKISVPSVLKSLGEVEIAAIDLGYVDQAEENDHYGNIIKQRSNVRMENNLSRNIVDMWLATE